MLPKKKNTNQLGFYSTFIEQLDTNHPLYKLSSVLNWQLFENSFSKHYSLTQGKPAKPIRLMVSLLILKQLRNLNDESVVEQWSENSYYQFFNGLDCFTSKWPCVATELVEFRKHIGADGIELIFKESIQPALFNAGVSSDAFIADSIIIVFHLGNAPYLADTSIATIVDINGNASVALPSSMMGNPYYITIVHRNSIETWTKLPVELGALTNVDFNTIKPLNTLRINSSIPRMYFKRCLKYIRYIYAWIYPEFTD